MLYRSLDDTIPIPPAEIVRRLQQIHPTLGLKWAPGCFWSEKRGRMVDSWAITEVWPDDDKRRQRARDGLLPLDECHDVLCFLPEDCPVDEAYGYVVRSMRSTSKESIKRLLDRVHAFNKEAQEAAWKPTQDLADELIEANAGTLFRDQGKTTPKVSAITHHPKESKASQAKKLREYSDQ